MSNGVNAEKIIDRLANQYTYRIEYTPATMPDDLQVTHNAPGQGLWEYKGEDNMFTDEAKTPLMNEKETRDINIKKVENGYIIQIGCKTFVTEDVDKMLEGIKLYLERPVEAQEKYCKKKEG